MKTAELGIGTKNKVGFSRPMTRYHCANCDATFYSLAIAMEHVQEEDHGGVNYVPREEIEECVR